MADRAVTETGLVVAAHSRRGKLKTLSGKQLPYLIQGRRLQVVCGDTVDWTLDDQGTLAIVTGIVPRTNALERQPLGRSGSETLAANLSLMIIVCACKPEPDWFLVDRYLCTGELMGCRLLLAGNKADLAEHDHATMLNDYQRIGYTCLSVSAQTNQGMDSLRTALQNQTGILVGQSGVGKSSLINRLVPEADITVGAISASTHEGIHTTTASAMHDLPDGGQLIDTPGVRDFIPAIPQAQSVQAGFPDIHTAADQCRFSNCLHLREPDCSVKLAVQNGTVSPRRYESYKRLLHTVTG
ncbi:MAG TPA: ribosome small subunit-dependent GTPase A [Gammaproteobacteria bacterium]|jgi:ribosome biogenesis GTPase|nr:ribosome small subunit-dependent GTPase A [Chromatiales bacterium]MCP4924702.1 ribosome small subunit-dependent GTPase A [Gammaproteobacteria bacterium]MDP7296290.1 ribosome small subunit-dependent GTPase A [Gammaproteobacteria bacterium]MDP7660763.1 ribosome small subunit-dependent GTPase A [Gammaproteobacteria bacterium]HJP38489.1 ribosome small subunit-dependent GTPase A [Gammaproteobacteria bacterium]